jgi:hypothetical protein
MKRILLFLALAIALVAAVSCEKTVSIAVDARATLIYPDGSSIQVSPQHFSFASRVLTDYELEYMVKSLIRNANQNFSSGILDIDIFDAMSGERLGSNSYGVVYNARDGRYDFASLAY